ncbi:hypothetical protein GmRootV116_19220 [Variovorax sp. V116]|jgi:hypothetical protein|uniref:Uncharacterized protein n=2 Tax=Variovorax paradoxus TaxID=34073 RepID=C5CV81_VARPS
MLPPQKMGGDAPADRTQVDAQLAEMEASGTMTTAELQTVQDDNAAERRAAVDRRQELTARAAELDITLERFAKLQAVYSSDLDREHSISQCSCGLQGIFDRFHTRRESSSGRSFSLGKLANRDQGHALKSGDCRRQVGGTKPPVRLTASR